MSKILLTGATGYVGGTVLSQLVSSSASSLSSLTIDVLMRDATKAAKVKAAYGDRVNTVPWQGGLDNVAFIEDTASNYDIIINTGSGFVPTGAIAFVNGLARRVKAGKPTPWFLHISGCTNLADRPLTQPPVPLREWNDEQDADEILEHMKKLDAAEPYPQRAAEIGVLEAAAATGVQAISINTPLIFGQGTGLFNQQALVIPLITMYVIQHGYGWVLNETANFDIIHVADLANLFVLITRAVLEREDRAVGYLPSGKRGIIFPTAGRVLIKDINQKCLDVAFATGTLPREGTPKTKEIRPISLDDIATKLTAGNKEVAERGWGGHKATNGVLATKLLGWKPTRLEEAWEKDFEDELVALKEDRRMITMANCIGQGEAFAQDDA